MGRVRGGVLRFDFDGPVGTAEPQPQSRRPERQEHSLTLGEAVAFVRQGDLLDAVNLKVAVEPITYGDVGRRA
jgi:hypothetical protein